MGNIWLPRKNIKKEMKSYSNVLAIDAKSVNTLNNLGGVFGASAENEKAFEYFNKALKIEPQNLDANYKFGNFLYRNRKVQALITATRSYYSCIYSNYFSLHIY